MRRRLQACLPAVAFAALAWVMVGAGGVPSIESLLAALSVGLAIVPSGWLAPVGWRRHAAEGMTLLPALALVLLADPTLRRMALPPLLVIAALATGAAALRIVARCDRPVIVVALALAVRLAGGLGLAGYPLWHDAVVVGAVTLVAGLAARVLSPRATLMIALLIGAAPLERALLPSLLGLAGVAVVFVAVASHSTWSDRLASAWSVGLIAVGLTVASLAPWGGIGLGQAVPAAGWILAAGGGAALIVTPLLPPALAGAAWLAVACLLGQPQPPPPDRQGLELTAASPEAVLPTSDGGLYIVEISLANASFLPQGSVVAVVRDIGPDVPIRVGIDTAEWAHERDDVRRVAAHVLPTAAAWRPAGYGKDSTWAVGGRSSWQLPRGARPRLVRSERLPPDVVVGVGAAGTSRPTPPRDWPLTSWILAAAVVVAVLQLAGRSWRSPAAFIPWALLTTLAIAARLPVSPLRLLAERHGVDLALAALLAAWLPAARAWLARGRTFATAAALLVPLAVATAHLMPPGVDAQYHLIVLRSLAEDHDLDLSNNYDLQHHPENSIYISSVFLHSPVLAFLLLPGYAAAGLPGALVVMALFGAGVVAAVTRGAGRLGLGRRRRALLVSALLTTYPLATFATQIWVEVPGALLAALALLCVGQPRPRIGVASLASFMATSLKTRLALATFPLPLVALVSRRRSRRELTVSLLVVGAMIAAGLAFGMLVYGHPLGPFRSLDSLLPRSLRQPLIVFFGLAFDAAGGLLYSAPLLALALLGSGRLWRQGGPGERGALLASALTVVALLSSPEWYGGGCPPVRYLVPLLPAMGLSAALVLRGTSRWRRLGLALLPAAFVVWWVMVTRPHLGFNPADGGSWLADALARRFAADARHLFPSFLRISTATFVAPVLIVIAGGLAILACGHHPGFARATAHLGASLWLVAGSVVVLTLWLRTDRVVEIEDPQIARIGGRLEPPPGTFSRWVLPNGWRVHDGEGVDVPLNLPNGARLRLEGWLEGAAQSGASLTVRWDGAAARPVPVAGAARGAVELPAPASGGHHRLGIVLAAPAGGEAVLDRIVVLP